jgi:mannose/fructose-specific phosphotransferase system component IIA
MMSDGVPVAIVIGHAAIAAGLVSAVEAITGEGRRLQPMSNQDLGREELEAVLRAEVERLGAEVIFTDLPGGSCAIAAQRVARQRGGITIVTGVNLAVLLHFVGHAADAGVVQQAVARAVDAMRVQPGVSRAD